MIRTHCHILISELWVYNLTHIPHLYIQDLGLTKRAAIQNHKSSVRDLYFPSDDRVIETDGRKGKPESY